MSAAAVKLRTATFAMEKELPSWTCKTCGSEVVMLNVIRGRDEDSGEETTVCCEWGNPDRPPYCPHCGTKMTP